LGRSSIVTVQPFSSRVTLTDRLLPSAVLLLDADERPLLDEETETELLDDVAPDACDCALALVALSSSTMLVSTRPSAK